MKRPSEMDNEELGKAIEDLSGEVTTESERRWREVFGAMVRELFREDAQSDVSPSLADLRAEVMRTAAVVQAKSMYAIALSKQGDKLTNDEWKLLFAADEETLNHLRERQRKLDPVLVEVGK